MAWPKTVRFRTLVFTHSRKPYSYIAQGPILESGAFDTPWSSNLHCMTSCMCQCLLNLLPRLVFLIFIMHVHVHDTCTHVSSHACTSSQSLVNIM